MPTRPTEHEECVIFVEYIEKCGYMFSHISNETPSQKMDIDEKTGKRKWRPNMWALKKLNAEGLRRGTPDYLIIVGKITVFVEMKRIKYTKSEVKDEQKEWIAALNMCHGTAAQICGGAEEAIAFVDNVAKMQESA